MPKRALSLKQIELRDAATKELYALSAQWMTEEFPHSGWPIRALNAVNREVHRLDKEIWDEGKTDAIVERFTRAKDLAIAASLRKQRVTYLQTVDALEILSRLARAWHQSEPHSRQEQSVQLHRLRCLLLEISNGSLENLDQRFHDSPDA